MVKFGKADKLKIGFLGQHRRQTVAQDGVIVSDHEAYTPFFVFTLFHVTLAAALLQNNHTHYNFSAYHTRLTSAFLQPGISVRADSLNANYSYKYFGKSQGVSAYTFRDERDLLWYSLVLASSPLPSEHGPERGNEVVPQLA